MSPTTFNHPHQFHTHKLKEAIFNLAEAKDRAEVELPEQIVQLITQACDTAIEFRDANEFKRFLLLTESNEATADTASAVMARDLLTGLTWQLASSSKRYEHAAAGTYAAALTTGGHADWRLPDLLELESIRDLSVFSPAVAAPFRDTVKPNWHWSSSVVPGDEVYARGVGFDDGDSYLGFRNYGAYVLAVRGGGPVAGSVPGQ